MNDYTWMEVSKAMLPNLPIPNPYAKGNEILLADYLTQVYDTIKPNTPTQCLAQHKLSLVTKHKQAWGR